MFDKLGVGVFTPPPPPPPPPPHAASVVINNPPSISDLETKLRIRILVETAPRVASRPTFGQYDIAAPYVLVEFDFRHFFRAFGRFEVLLRLEPGETRDQGLGELLDERIVLADRIVIAPPLG